MKDASPRYDEAAAEPTGQSERTVRREVTRGEALGEAVLAKVARTSFDKGEELDALAKLPEDQRETLIERAATGEDVSAKSVLVNGARAIMGSRKEPGNSLDYFPTGPWATCALIEHVFPHLGVRDLYTYSALSRPAARVISRNRLKSILDASKQATFTATATARCCSIFSATACVHLMLVGSSPTRRSATRPRPSCSRR